MNHLRKRLMDIYKNHGISGILRGVFRFIKFRIRERPAYIKFSSYQSIIKNRYKGYHATPHPLKEVDVAPENIVSYCDAFEKYGYEGAVRGGDWDQNSTPIAESTKYRGIKQRYIDQCDWEDTVIFDEFKQIIQRGEQKDGVYSYEKLIKRYEQIDELYTSINENGVLSRSDRPVDSATYDDILVNIGRDGALLFNGNGWHRLCIAKILNLDTIPVRIYVRHSEWQQRRERVYSGEIPPEVTGTHPDLRNIVGS